MGALEIARSIAAGTVSASEVVESHLQRIAEVNPAVNAITRTLESEARAAAGEVDRRQAAGEALAPLAGVPFSIKESIDALNTPTTFGVPALRAAYPTCDAPIVRRLREAGAIPLARTNLPDLSMRFHTASQLYGHTRNPWAADLSPGGSSGGEGVALATGMSPLGLGSDAGGSVRIPALFGGVCALKPTYGRIPSSRTVGPPDLSFASQMIPVEGLLARSVEDLALALRIVSGPDPGDPRVVPAPISTEPVRAPLRVAVIPDPGGQGVHAAVKNAVSAAAEILRVAGHEPEYVEVPRLDEALDTHARLLMTEFSLAWPMLQRLLAPDGRRYIEYSMAGNRPAELHEYIGLTAKFDGIRREWCQFLDRYPLVLAPVFTELAVPVGFDIAGPEEHRRVGRAMRMCAVTSLVGVPAVSVPTTVCRSVCSSFPDFIGRTFVWPPLRKSSVRSAISRP
jgi:amidase